MKAQYNLSHAVFGDIDLLAHREWEEKVCATAGLVALLPLWQQNRKALVTEMINTGIETIIVSCNTVMGEKFLGEKLSLALVDKLEALGVDACGENGEFHTLVVNCPLFAKPVPVKVLATMQHEGYWFSALVLEE